MYKYGATVLGKQKIINFKCHGFGNLLFLKPTFFFWL